jgi:hypothetical protein
MEDLEFHQVLQAHQFRMAVVELVLTLMVPCAMEDLIPVLVVQLNALHFRTQAQVVLTA